MNREIQPSRILTRIQQREHEMHRQRLMRSRPHFKINEPVKPPHLQYNWKRIQVEREKKIKMLRDNESLVQKMLKIESNPGRLDPQNLKNPPSHGSLNTSLRVTQFEKRELGNRMMLSLIRNAKSSYSASSLLKEYNQHAGQLKRQISKNQCKNSKSRDRFERNSYFVNPSNYYSFDSSLNNSAVIRRSFSKGNIRSGGHFSSATPSRRSRPQSATHRRQQ